ncbi:NYN domain-containing protein [Paeniroseomonas aquatica]|uniref:NYN domain-containing protein n=1 Tax=Paeniroseomonas aquatica TaxID=373043 RepID=UPI00360B99FE
MPEPRRAALYVDFDNVFSTLAALDEWAAWSFAANPGRWLDWLAEALPGGPRRLLVRRCYLNPAGWTEPEAGGGLARWLGQPRIYYSRFRGDFVRAGFTVVDCPRLARLKNAADIVMALDIADAIGHATRFEEFLILSGDSDFTPLLHRLREHDRRTLVITHDASALAFRAAADAVLPLGDFAEAALLPEPAGPVPALPAVSSGAHPPAATEPDAVADPGEPEAQRSTILAALRRMVAAAADPLHLPALGKRIHVECGGWVRRSRFGGAGTLAKLIEGAPDLMLEAGPGGGWLYDPRRHEPPALAQAETGNDPLSRALAELRPATAEGTELPRLGPEELDSCSTGWRACCRCRAGRAGRPVPPWSRRRSAPASTCRPGRWTCWCNGCCAPASTGSRPPSPPIPPAASAAPSMPR